MSKPEVLAAGGVVVREGKVALIHRPKYDDWSLPKGKLDPGEAFGQAALREVEEETGLRCRLGPEVARSRYRDSKGRSKLVRYFRMEPVNEGSFEPTEEVDELRWLPPAEAARQLSYDRDRDVLAAAGRSR
jgi:8-oxo-dGTP diphosphatase